MDIAETLAGSPFFQSFPPDLMEGISRFTTSHTLEAGETVHAQGGATTHFFVLVEGRVELRLPGNDEGSGFLMRRVAPGEPFGISPLLGSERYTTHGVCVEPSTVLFIEAQPFIALLRASPLLDHQVMRMVARAYFNRYQLLAELVQRFLSDPSLR